MRRFAGVISYGLTFFVVGRVLAGRVNGRMCCRSARVTEPSKTAFLRPLERGGLLCVSACDKPAETRAYGVPVSAGILGRVAVSCRLGGISAKCGV